MEKSFIKIGDRYVNVEHIIEIHCDNAKKMVYIITMEMIPESVGSDSWVAESARIGYCYGSPEAESVIAWADRQAETLV